MPLFEPAWPVLLADVVLDDGCEEPLVPVLLPPEGPPAIEPPVARPAACANPFVPARSTAKQTELVATVRLPNAFDFAPQGI